MWVEWQGHSGSRCQGVLGMDQSVGITSDTHVYAPQMRRYAAVLGNGQLALITSHFATYRHTQRPLEGLSHKDMY